MSSFTGIIWGLLVVLSPVSGEIPRGVPLPRGTPISRGKPPSYGKALAYDKSFR